MGTFTTKWREAAAVASSTMADTLYARYYGLPPAEMWATESTVRSRIRLATRWGKPMADDFAVLCKEHSREAAAGDGSSVARNGTVIEQSQILTTHNLAPLVERLDLREDIAHRSVDLAMATFQWIVREQNTDYRSWHSKLSPIAASHTADVAGRRRSCPQSRL